MIARLEHPQLRLAWLLLLANTILVFGYPAMFFVIAGDEYRGERLAVHEAWSWDWQVWLAPLAALVVPRLGAFSYVGRLAIVAGFCLPAWLVLLQTTFLEPFGCMRFGWVRTVPEHLAFASVLLAALLSQPPMERIRNPVREW